MRASAGADRSLGVLISGRGSNLQALIAAIGDGRLDARIGVVISNRPLAAGLEHARRAAALSRHRAGETDLLYAEHFGDQPGLEAAGIESKAIDIGDSDLPLRIAFPLLVSNALQWLSGEANEAPLSVAAAHSTRLAQRKRTLAAARSRGARTK